MQNTLVFVTILTACVACGAELKVGVGRMVITPDTQPVWLAGYAARTVPSTGMIHHVWAKALVIEETPGKRVALITADVLGLTREITAVVSQRLNAKYGIERSRIFFNSSHTHSGPVVWPNLSVCCDFTQDKLLHVVGQNRKMTDNIIAAVDMAVRDLAPARLSVGWGSAGFAINRRKRAIAPVDHTVPVLRIAAPDGTVRAVLFNYACHNTTLTGGNLLINGDYAGFAMLELEAAYPGATVLFVQGCGADQNPDPRGTEAHARKYGKELADAVKAVLAGGMKPVGGPVRTGFAETRLDFPPFDVEVYRAELVGNDKFRQRRAQLMLEAYNSGNPIRSIPYPVQALRFGEGLTLLFLSGEVVIDYALRAKRDYAGENLIVAGYCNEVPCYVPSLRVLQEGGYEADESMVYYGQPGPFTETVEGTVFDAIKAVLRDVGVTNE
ncbi:MAG TPA: neutral/alkaline non-lysosomal ceramidase N-terminal domain-containing protein [Kiritimatiellia bacterium]|nr:neutral/alkaline non-lysosomal ceramidase N-terminal domain-containing protein [Kiritimatiellia bacterium]HRR34384.1 neutral/alkaline non-lysosomal ceramidase N-terminal domain-containing protein [Kiritimatiellia bacterium]HRU71152.1 neutral/alkaline non-lysosomal ceramidase N-terminal domain-containing protein [Kiritimatiellia bacterium]